MRTGTVKLLVVAAAALLGAAAVAGAEEQAPAFDVLTTTTSGKDCSTPTVTTTQAFFGKKGAGLSPGCTKNFETKVGPAGASAPMPPLPSAQSVASGLASGPAPNGELDATRTVGGNCGGNCPQYSLKASASRAVEKVDAWLRRFKRYNRLDPNSVARDTVGPILQIMERRSEEAVEALKIEQQAEREHMKEDIAAHEYNVLSEEQKTGVKRLNEEAPKPADSRPFFDKIKGILNARFF